MSSKDNTISFAFALPYFWGQNNYSYFLEGYSQKWSLPSEEPKVRFINLRQGDYVFRVVGINIYGKRSPEAVFHFTILPPWYQTIYAYTGYVLLLFLLIFGIVKIVVFRYKKANEHLEAVVTERTQELKKANVQLNQLVDEVQLQRDNLKNLSEDLKQKNQMITDSILYAQRIQQAMLPDNDSLNRSKIESFVFFQPRDIVSGDFYWTKETPDAYFYAVADCTGHGVPGAFVSMIGNTLLNQIIIENQNYSPAEILKRLNTEIKTIFSASTSDTQADGMDISLCKILKNKPLIQVAQANRQLILKHKKGFEVIDGDIYSIGGPFSLPERMNFTNREFSCDKTTMLYLFSDGFADQFDKGDNHKYMFARFLKLIEDIVSLPPDKQLDMLTKEFNEWKGNRSQIDDVTVLGIKCYNKPLSKL
ncbi:MAG: SpoIIE family protein phosphatase [Bacteroidales bacterium]|nr:SpoIIE family protein phosphatase [Bacteroidales bacterium]